jgi:hypothetical protein
MSLSSKTKGVPFVGFYIILILCYRYYLLCYTVSLVIDNSSANMVDQCNEFKLQNRRSFFYWILYYIYTMLHILCYIYYVLCYTYTISVVIDNSSANMVDQCNEFKLQNQRCSFCWILYYIYTMLHILSFMLYCFFSHR